MKLKADVVSSIGRLAAQELPLGLTLLLTPASLMTRPPILQIFPFVFPSRSIVGPTEESGTN